MTLETMVKALAYWAEHHALGPSPAQDVQIMYYDGYRLGAQPGTPGRELLDAAYDADPDKYDSWGYPEEAAAAACDALQLPWQEHPVWRQHKALEALKSRMASLADVINLELREAGRLDLQIDNEGQDFRPFVRALVDAVREQTKWRARETAKGSGSGG